MFCITKTANKLFKYTPNQLQYDVVIIPELIAYVPPLFETISSPNSYSVIERFR